MSRSVGWTKHRRVNVAKKAATCGGVVPAFLPSAVTSVSESMATPTRSGAPINAHMATVIQQRDGIAESHTLYGSPSGHSAHAIAKRKNLTKMLAKRMQQEHGADAVRAALIQGELDTFGPLQRGDALTPRDLAQLESNVKRAVQVVPG